MRVGILGCGYVGSAVATDLQQYGFEVAVTTRQPERIPLLEELTPHVFVLPNQFLSFIENLDILLISIAPDRHSDYRSTYLDVVQHVIDELPQATRLKKIIYTSSTSVYGEHEGNWVDEMIPVQPINENTRILDQTEQLLLSINFNQVNTCIFRLGEIYGPQREIRQKLKERQGQFFPGDGSSFINIIHLHDIIKAIRLACLTPLNGIYNLCNDVHIPRKQLYEKICHEEGVSPIQWNSTFPKIHGGNKRVSNQKIKQLGFHFYNEV